MKLTPEQLQTLRHMLGIDKPFDRRPTPSRNYAAVPPGDAAFQELARLGAVTLTRKAGEGSGQHDYYECTEAGRTAAMKSHLQIRQPKAKRVYRKFLLLQDALPHLTFAEFLTSPDFAEERRNA